MARKDYPQAKPPLDLSQELVDREAALWQKDIDRIAVNTHHAKQSNSQIFSYEYLCENTHEVLENILKWCGLDTQKYPFKHVPKRIRCTNSDRVANVSDELLNRIDQALNPIIERYKSRVPFLS
jgi:hypothetical protein